AAPLPPRPPAPAPRATRGLRRCTPGPASSPALTHPADRFWSAAPGDSPRYSPSPPPDSRCRPRRARDESRTHPDPPHTNSLPPPPPRRRHQPALLTRGRQRSLHRRQIAARHRPDERLHPEARRHGQLPILLPQLERHVQDRFVYTHLRADRCDHLSPPGLRT